MDGRYIRWLINAVTVTRVRRAARRALLSVAALLLAALLDAGQHLLGGRLAAEVLPRLCASFWNSRQ